MDQHLHNTKQNQQPTPPRLLQSSFVVCLLAILCNALWGSAFPAIKSGYRLFEIPGNSPASQILFAGIRFFLAGFLALVFGSLLQKRILIPKKSSIPMVLKLSVFQTILQYIFFYLIPPKFFLYIRLISVSVDRLIKYFSFLFQHDKKNKN